MPTWLDFVRNTQNLWMAYRLSITVRSRPSQIYGVEERYGPYQAYCFDSAVATFGTALEAELDSIEGKTSKEINQKRDRTLRKWLGLPLKFRNPGGPTATRITSVEGSQDFKLRSG